MRLLTHHYETDERGFVKEANLIVGTTNNDAAISMSPWPRGVRTVPEPTTLGVCSAALSLTEAGRRRNLPT